MIPPFLIPSGLAEIGRIAAVAVLVASATAPLAYCKGMADEAAAEDRREAQEALEAEQRQRRADQNRARAAQRDQAQIHTNRQEVKDATAAIPDQALSDRQRVRACIELRRTGRTDAACGPIQPR